MNPRVQYPAPHRRGPPAGGPSNRRAGMAGEPATVAALRRSPAKLSLIKLSGRKFCGGPDLNRRLPTERDLKSRACTRLGHPRVNAKTHCPVAIRILRGPPSDGPSRRRAVTQTTFGRLCRGERSSPTMDGEPATGEAFRRSPAARTTYGRPCLGGSGRLRKRFSMELFGKAFLSNLIYRIQ